MATNKIKQLTPNKYTKFHTTAKAVVAGTLIVPESGGVYAYDVNAPNYKLTLLQRVGALHRVRKGHYDVNQNLVEVVASTTKETWAAMDSQFWDYVVQANASSFRVIHLQEWSGRTKQACLVWIGKAEEAGLLEPLEGSRGYAVTEKANYLTALVADFF